MQSREVIAAIDVVKLSGLELSMTTNTIVECLTACHANYYNDLVLRIRASAIHTTNVIERSKNKAASSSVAP
jgi:hypothetical protein